MIKTTTRYVLSAIGLISFALGVIGAFLPVLPTTPFMLLAAFCFSKSSKRLHSWLTSLPYFGSAIIEWENNKVIRPRAKILAITLIWLSIGATIIWSSIIIAVKVFLGFIAISVSLFILTRKSYAENHSRNSLTDQ